MWKETSVIIVKTRDCGSAVSLFKTVCRKNYIPYNMQHTKTVNKCKYASYNTHSFYNGLPLLIDVNKVYDVICTQIYS